MSEIYPSAELEKMTGIDQTRKKSVSIKNILRNEMKGNKNASEYFQHRDRLLKISSQELYEPIMQVHA